MNRLPLPGFRIGRLHPIQGSSRARAATERKNSLRKRWEPSDPRAVRVPLWPRPFSPGYNAVITMNANQVFQPLSMLSRSLVTLGALLLLVAPGQASSNGELAGSPTQEGSRGRNQETPRSKSAPKQNPAPRQGKQGGAGRGQAGERGTPAKGQRGQNERQQPQREQGQREQADGANADARRAANARAQAQKERAERARAEQGQGQNDAQRAANAREQAEQNQAREQGRKVPMQTRAENARRQKLEADQAQATRVQNAREQAAANGTELVPDETDNSERAQAARAQSEAKRIENAREKANGASQLAPNEAEADRVANARRQRAERIGSQTRQMTPAQKATRIANARRQFAALTPEQDAATRRFLAAQHVHNDRMARMQRIEDLLERKGDRANLARLRALRAKQVALNERDHDALGTILGPDQMRAAEDTAEIGTRTARGESN